MGVGCAVLYSIFGHDVQEAQVCRQVLNKEQDLLYMRQDVLETWL